MKVLKFGGTSVETAERIKNLANIVKTAQQDHTKLIVVVSALAKVTDLLIKAAGQAVTNRDNALQTVEIIREKYRDVYQAELQHADVNASFENLFVELDDILRGISLIKEYSARTLDFVMSFGERTNAFLLAEYLVNHNLNAEFIDARECVVTDQNHGSARVLFPRTFEKINKRLNQDKIYIVTGFVAATEGGITTTLGRGGSDFTAAIFGAALDAQQVEIWTDVDGFMSADPRLVEDAFVLPFVSYEEAMELSYFGAKVIHPLTLVPAIEQNIPVLIKNSFDPEKPGTKISPEVGDYEHAVKGIASFDQISLINIQGSGMVGVPGIAGRVFSTLAEQKINIVMITQASSEHSICFVVQTRESDAAVQAIRDEFQSEIFSNKIDKIEKRDNLSIIAAVGDNMAGTPGIAGKLFDALGENSINVIAIAQGSSERNVSLVVESKEAVKAVNVIHSAFYLSQRVSHVFLVGTGAVGSTLIKQIYERQQETDGLPGLQINICGLSNSRKMLINPKGIDLKNWKERLAAATEPASMQTLLETIMELELPHTILVDVTASDMVAGHYLDILSAGIHIVTPNKKANTMEQSYYDSLMQKINEHRLHYYYEATVGAGLPIINTITDLKNSGDQVIKIEGILSGTLSYLFNTMSKEQPFSKVLKKAHKNGYTEPDPRDDLSGMDVARKLLILGREIGFKMELGDVQVDSILPPEMFEGDLDSFWDKVPSMDVYFNNLLAQAEQEGKVLRYVAKLDKESCKVEIDRIPSSHALARAGATDNIIQITTKRYYDSPLTIQGPGAGLEVTAGGVFADIIRLSYHLS